MWPRGVGLALSLCSGVVLGGCDGCGRSGETPAAGADAGQAGLSPEQARLVLARVGQRSITLGDYAAALDRMDPFERMRYQTDDRRQALLDEMINVELLAREAERRGLDRKPETVELVRQYQRDELLRRLRASVPGPNELPSSAVQAYYAEHRADFLEPEWRRAAQIVVSDASLAARVLSEATGADADHWRALVQRYNPALLASDGDKTAARPPLEVPGDLGLLTAVAPAAASGAAASGAALGSAAGGAAEIPEPVRKAVFEIAEVGQVLPRVVSHAGRYHVLRLVSRMEPRQRALTEVDAIVRTRLVALLQEQAERDLVTRLRQSIPVSIDEAALERVPEPGAVPAQAQSPRAP